MASAEGLLPRIAFRERFFFFPFLYRESIPRPSASRHHNVSKEKKRGEKKLSVKKEVLKTKLAEPVAVKSRCAHEVYQVSYFFCATSFHLVS